MPTPTTNLSMSKPDVGQSNWGTLMNTNLDILDALFPSGVANAGKLQGNPVSATAPTPSYVLTWNGSSWVPAALPATGVTSVGLTVPSWLTVAGSPVTGAGTLAVTASSGQTQNQFLATPNGSSGAVGLRSIVAADIPSLSATYLSLSGGGTVVGAVTFTGTAISGAAGVATSGANFNSDSDTFRGSYWTGSAAANDDWSIQNILGTGTNPTSILTLAHTGSTGNASVLFPAGSATAAGVAVGTTGFGMRQTATQLHLFVNGSPVVQFVASGGIQCNLNTAATPTWYSINNDCMWRRLGSRIWESGGNDSATPAASTVQIGESSRPATDTDIGGANGTIRTGNGTGVGTLPKFIEQTPAPVASGTGAQSFVSRRILGHSNAALANNTATLFVRTNANALTSMALLVSYTVEVKTATAVQVETGFVSLSNITDSTPTISVGTAVKSGTVNNPSTGTLVVSFAGTVNGSSVDWKITSNSSLTPTTHRVMFEIINLGFHSSDIVVF